MNPGAGWAWLAIHPAIDPAIGWWLRAFLALLFLRSALPKLRAHAEFVAAIERYELLPAALAAPAAGFLLVCEAALVVLLLAPVPGPGAAIGAASLLALYTAAISLNLARGRRDIDCGCAGPLRRQTLHESLVVRNLVYIAMAVAASLPVSNRSLGGLDLLTILLGVAAATASSIAADELAAVAPRARALSQRSRALAEGT